MVMSNTYPAWSGNRRKRHRAKFSTITEKPLTSTRPLYPDWPDRPAKRKKRSRAMMIAKAQAQSEARRAYMQNVAARGEASMQQRAVPITLPKLKFLET